MDFTYRFYAVEGIQAGKKYYIAMVPLKLVSKLLVSDTEEVLPEYRAQRKINEARIPEIKDYIINNRDNYVFSALSASIDGEFEFSSISGNAGILEIDMNSTLLINDGQHRKAAIVKAMEEDQTLENETISVVFFEDGGLEKSQQMFTDLNKHAVKTSNSLSTLYNSRDLLAVYTKELIQNNYFFNAYTDKEKDILGKNSSKLFTLNSIYKANERIFKKKDLNENDFNFMSNYWEIITNNISEWNDLVKKEITKKDLRENYIVTLSIFLIALGKLGNYFYENNFNIEDYASQLLLIDWSRSNKQWVGRAFRENGKILTGEESINYICSNIKVMLGIPLTQEEKRKEKQLKERKYGTIR